MYIIPHLFNKEHGRRQCVQKTCICIRRNGETLSTWFCVCVCVCVCTRAHTHAQSLSHVWLLHDTMPVAFQAPLSVGFPRQEYWSGLSFLLQGLDKHMMCLNWCRESWQQWLFGALNDDIGRMETHLHCISSCIWWIFTIWMVDLF